MLFSFSDLYSLRGAKKEMMRNAEIIEVSIPVGCKNEKKFHALWVATYMHGKESW